MSGLKLLLVVFLCLCLFSPESDAWRRRRRRRFVPAPAPPPPPGETSTSDFSGSWRSIGHILKQFNKMWNSAAQDEWQNNTRLSTRLMHRLINGLNLRNGKKLRNHALFKLFCTTSASCALYRESIGHNTGFPDFNQWRVAGQIGHFVPFFSMRRPG